jgi:transcriptional regulator with XRE-family HTH domain
MNIKIIKIRLADLDMSVQDFCQQIQISRTTFYKYIDGRINPSPKLLKKISEHLQIPIEDLSNDTPEKRETFKSLREDLDRKNKIIDELLERIETLKNQIP